MTLTLITATYNSVKTLKSCLDSVAAQDYKDYEHLMIDGASTDGTLEFLEGYRESHPHLRVISEPDAGIYDALNKGVSNARGNIVGFVHSDDMLADSGVLNRIIKCFNNGNPDGVYGDLEYVRQEDPDRVVRHWKSAPLNRDLLQKGWMPPHPTLFLKKSVYDKHGAFDLSYQIAADYDFMLRIFQDTEYAFTYLPGVITKMRVGGASNRSLKNILQKSREDLRAMRANQIAMPFLALGYKNLSKLPQFFRK
ncbi:glycosyltransferase family 2 protein [Robiginitalea biformata]|uniref:Probable glycosyltransferase n=1 Tax=Robiginitalea biformata (strain ATCC BAA-864 / DSM 15991 / KCTC 12146 / HTCC2501) TaxID=313596 RepID=A4CP30_ROBBH|nr:glycosyltransferase family 2 protein [Robiginitalea biformata]EAR14647.1 probable glycosyltransferase [Robiginitalea biformata HTCC2501]